MLNDVQAMVLRQLPYKIEMVGGPFCGVTLYTRKNRVSDVISELLGVEAKKNGIERWVPIARQEIHGGVRLPPPAGRSVAFLGGQDGRFPVPRVKSLVRPKITTFHIVIL
jgi:hypothetical protein